jgi:undecaprenyl phosphate N,N'-diacetylbacillosamine 1-phosphate transferase
MMYNFFLKRFFDFLLSLMAIIILSPLLLIICFILNFANKGAGILFTQKRVGKKAKVFNIYKFKTMSDLKDINGKLLPDEVRVSKVGNFLRSTSIDELPQLFNVLIGDMSLIGPRPLLEKYVPLYSDYQFRRHEVKPGISGWAQCNGRNAITWNKKFELDVWYVDNISLFTDFKIIVLTLKKVIQRKDITSGNSFKFEPFNGKN